MQISLDKSKLLGFRIAPNATAAKIGLKPTVSHVIGAKIGTKPPALSHDGERLIEV